jgi:TonB family protein
VAKRKKTFWIRHVRFLHLIVLWGIVMTSLPMDAQNAAAVRQARTTAKPHYPELARRLNLSATVKVQVTVSSSGAVLDAKATGGHPMFIAPSLDAAKKWHYEPAGQNTTEVIQFHFSPGAS